MADLYPVFLNLRDCPCLLVGAGRVAERKVGGLLAARARVTVVAPEATPSLRARSEKSELRWLRRCFEARDLEGMRLAFVATSQPEVNRSVVSEARARGVLLNVADGPLECDFQVPAVLRRGPITIAVSTAGTSPALAARIRDGLGERLPSGLEDVARVLGVLREMAPKEEIESGKVADILLDAGLMEDLAQGDWASADKKVSRIFPSAPSVKEIMKSCSMEKR